jgi:hypothetical protein
LFSSSSNPRWRSLPRYVLKRKDCHHDVVVLDMTNLDCGVVSLCDCYLCLYRSVNKDCSGQLCRPIPPGCGCQPTSAIPPGSGRQLYRPIPPGCGCQRSSANTAWVRVPNSRCHEPRPQPLLKDLERGGTLGQVAVHLLSQTYFGHTAWVRALTISANTAWVRAPTYFGHTAWVRAPTISANTAWVRVPTLVGQYRLGAGATGISPL